MKLSDFEVDKFGIKLVRDGIFESLGSFTKEKMNMLVFIVGDKYIPNLLNEPDKYSCVICKSECLPLIPPSMGVGVSLDPETSFYLLHNHLAKTCPSYPMLPETDISPNATIHQTAFIDTHVKIADGCIIHPNATILRGTILEENVIVGPGSVIGGEGFRFLRRNSDVMPIVHVGGVILEKGVEIQSNSCIDKAVYSDFTVIGEQTKIDNMVHIGHNVRIGKRCLLAASSMIGGSTIIEDEVWIGPNASISDNLFIGRSANISLGAVVTKNVASGMSVSGNFAIEHSKFIDFIKSIR